MFVGVLGFLVWIGLWWFDRELLGVGALFSTTREAFNPFAELSDSPTWMWLFLAIRLAGLVAVVPIIEEFFLRGFLMRYLDARNWDRVPLGNVTRLSVIGVAVYALVSHPAEPLAAVVWFSMVTWLYARTRSIWIACWPTPPRISCWVCTWSAQGLGSCGKRLPTTPSTSLTVCHALA